MAEGGDDGAMIRRLGKVKSFLDGHGLEGWEVVVFAFVMAVILDHVTIPPIGDWIFLPILNWLGVP
jgi:hypothetical protein